MRIVCDVDEVLAQLAAASSQPVDGWHQCVLDATAAEVHLALERWDEAAPAAEQGWESTGRRCCCGRRDSP